MVLEENKAAELLRARFQAKMGREAAEGWERSARAGARGGFAPLWGRSIPRKAPAANCSVVLPASGGGWLVLNKQVYQLTCLAVDLCLSAHNQVD